MSDLPCPTCGRVNDAHQGAPDVVPVNGDVSLCWGCGAAAVFVDVDGSLALRLPTPAEAAEIDADPEVAAARAAMAAAAYPSQAVAAVWGSS